jgi:hypothetical protein
MCLQSRSVTKQATQFSTASVDALRKSLWKSGARYLAIKHLAQRAEILRKSCAQFSTAIVESIR